MCYEDTYFIRLSSLIAIFFCTFAGNLKNTLFYMRYLRNDNTDPLYNMAFDEYALEQLPLDEPLFFLWQNSPSVIIGLNQNVYSEVNLDYLREHGIILARRVTGGGAVYHDLGNLNYTIVGRSADLERDYPEYARHMLRALQALGVDAELSGRNDILVGGRKVSGYAKRVYKDRLMVHGTLMYDVDLDRLTAALTPSAEKLTSKGIASVRSRVTNLRQHLPQVFDINDFRHQLERHLSRNYEDKEYPLSDEQLATIAYMRNHKFATYEWVYGRSPHTALARTARFACGSIEAHLDITEGLIARCHICGDFMGNLPTSDIESLLQGVRYERDALRACIAQTDISLYFDRLTAEEFLSLLI